MVLVTGASGFLGQHLVQYLSAQGEAVRALYHRHEPTGDLRTLPRIEWVQCDLLDVYDVAKVMEGISSVYHCAAVVSFNPKRREDMLHFNVESTANVVNEALERDVNKLVHVSSVAALGRSKENKKEITEEIEWEESGQNSVYGQSKYLSEMEVWRGIGEGLNAVIINPGIILGEGDWNDGSAHLMKVVYNQFPFYTMGVNGWVDVKDVVRIMHLLMQRDITTERFIVNGGSYTYKDIFTMMANAVHRKPPGIHARPWMTDLVARLLMLKSKVLGGPNIITRETARNGAMHCYYSTDKLLKYLNDFSYTPLESTIKRMGEAFLLDMNKK